MDLETLKAFLKENLSLRVVEDLDGVHVELWLDDDCLSKETLPKASED